MNVKMRWHIVLIALCFHITSAAQSSVSVKPLKIGDIVPDIEFKLLNDNNHFFKLSDFRGKLVILDFWASWCGACIDGFPTADSIQKLFGETIKIILVNSRNRTKPDSKAKLDAFYKKWKQQFPEFSLPIAYEDTLAYSFFPHSGLPHYVWISPQGRVAYITSGKSITIENINKFLDGRFVDVTVKDGYIFDALYIDGISPFNLSEFSNFSLFRRSELKSVKPTKKIIGLRIGNESMISRAVFRNVTLPEIFKEAVRHKKELFLNKKRWKVEVFDPVALDTVLYTYDLVMPEASPDLFCSIMLDELNRYTNYEARVEKRKTRCIVLIKTSNQDKLKSSGRKSGIQLNDKDSLKYLRNRELSYLVHELNSKEEIKLPVLDETGYSGKVDIEFGYFGDDLTRLKTVLQKYGLDLLEVEREIEVFVIKDKAINQ